MLIHELGGEFKLLEHILRSKAHPSVLVNNGDDAAVIRCGNELFAVSVDAFVSGRHFSFDYFTPEQIGIKAIEGSASDIVAMGGSPQFVFVSIVVPAGLQVEVVSRLYAGMYSACERLGAVVLGGDTTSGTDKLVVSISVIGKIRNEREVCTRSGARPGDLLFVSGDLGGSACGLTLLQSRVAGYEEVKLRHLEPRCRIDLQPTLAPIASSMIDISDGLSSELHHLAVNSKCGAVLREAAIPLSAAVRTSANSLGFDPYHWALNGGEDFELLYTVDPQDRALAIGTEIGIMTSGLEVQIERNGARYILKAAGFDHF